MGVEDDPDKEKECRHSAFGLKPDVEKPLDVRLKRWFKLYVMGNQEIFYAG